MWTKNWHNLIASVYAHPNQYTFDSYASDPGYASDLPLTVKGPKETSFAALASQYIGVYQSYGSNNAWCNPNKYSLLWGLMYAELNIMNAIYAMPWSTVIPSNSSAENLSYSSSIQGTIGVCVGDGTITEENQYTAYNLNSPIRTGIVLADSVNPVTDYEEYDATNRKFTKHILIDLTNNTSNTIDISEIGLFGYWLPAQYTASTARNFAGKATGPRTYDQRTLLYYDSFDTISLEPNDIIRLDIVQEIQLS